MQARLFEHFSNGGLFKGLCALELALGKRPVHAIRPVTHDHFNIARLTSTPNHAAGRPHGDAFGKQWVFSHVTRRGHVPELVWRTAWWVRC